MLLVLLVLLVLLRLLVLVGVGGMLLGLQMVVLGGLLHHGDDGLLRRTRRARLWSEAADSLTRGQIRSSYTELGQVKLG